MQDSSCSIVIAEEEEENSAYGREIVKENVPTNRLPRVLLSWSSNIRECNAARARCQRHCHCIELSPDEIHCESAYPKSLYHSK